jgi:amphi-Trp domain-containing protein
VLASSKKKFSYSSLEDPGSVVVYLRAIIEGLESGQLELSDDEDTLALQPGPLVNFDIRASEKKDYAQLKLELRWSLNTERKSGGQLSISG